jgi:DNA polymerase III epsilon subunit-like protein
MPDRDLPERDLPDAATPDTEAPETFVSVDVETAGPNPSSYSLLSIGACLVDAPDQGFYIELQPVGEAVVESSLAVGGLSMEHLAEAGVAPVTAMEQFEQWLAATVPAGHKPVFVGFNAPFDWMFVADYFERFLGRNPFGHAAIDIKAYYMGLSGSTWARTSLRFLSPLYLDGSKLSHNALGDARDQAQLFRAMRAEAAARH